MASGETTAVPDAEQQPRWRRVVRARRLAMLLGLILGVWLSMPVEGDEERVYQVHDGDSLELVAKRTGVDPETLIALNQDAYPLIAEGQALTGWELVYKQPGDVPRWRALAAAMLEIDWLEATLERAGTYFKEQTDKEQMVSRLDAANAVSWINYTRKVEGLPKLVAVEELNLLAGKRAAIYAGSLAEPLGKYPLPAGCVELRSKYFAGYSVTEDWQYRARGVLMGDFEAIGAGEYVNRDGRTVGQGAAVVIAIFCPDLDAVEGD